MIINGVVEVSRIDLSDSGTPAEYTITPNITSMSEGATVTYTILGIYFSSNTLYWTNSGSTSADDFTDGQNSGSVVLDNFGKATLSRTLVADLTTEGNENIIIELRTGSISGPIVATATTVTVIDSSTTPVGQIAYTTPGSYSWVVPPGVLSICAVIVGAGGSGAHGGNGAEQAGGGGGGLRYINNFAVTPGETLTAVVGAGGTSPAVTTSGNTGGTSQLLKTSNILVQAFGGSGATYVNGSNAGGSGGSGSTTGAGPFGGTIGGGNGGVGGSTTGNANGGGGGAGGYSGNGGAGQNDGGTFGSLNQGTGGAAAGGATGGTIGGAGGGVGILGQSTSGTSASAGGSSGTNGGVADTGTGGGAYGGGSGGSDGNPNNPGPGGSGAVRIIWGPGRAFPSTNTNDL